MANDLLRSDPVFAGQGTTPAAPASRAGDPLAELARIIGSGDSFREQLRSGEVPARVEPDMGEEVMPSLPLRGASAPAADVVVPPTFDWDDLEAELAAFSAKTPAPVSPAAPQQDAADVWDAPPDVAAHRPSAAEQDWRWQEPVVAEPIPHEPTLSEPLTLPGQRAPEAEIGRDPVASTAFEHETFAREAHQETPFDADAMASHLAAARAPAGIGAPRTSTHPDDAWANDPTNDAYWRDHRDGSGSERQAYESEAVPGYSADHHLAEPDAAFEDAAPPRRRSAGLLTIGVVVGLAAVGAAGAVAYRSFTGGARSGEAKVVHADPTPAKVAGPAAVENAKRVQDRVPAGGEQIASREEQPLTPRAQDAQVQSPTPPQGMRVIPLSPPKPDSAESAAPAAPAPVAAAPVAPAPAPAAPVPAPAAPAAAATPPAPVAPAPAAPAASAPTPVPTTMAPTPAPRPASADEPRRVKTVAVGPDGSVRQQPVTAPLSVVPTRTVPVTNNAAPAAPAAAPRAATSEAAPAPRPAARQPVNAPMALVPPAGGATPRAAANEGGAGGFVVQLASQKSESEARAAYAGLQRKHSALAGLAPNIRSADLGDRGTFYRVRVGPMSRENATALCQKLKSGGGDCIVQPR